MSFDHWAEDIVEIELSEDGALRIMMGRLGDSVDGRQVLFDSAAVIYVRRLLGLVHAVFEEAGYFGSWALAVGATGLRGLAAHDMHQYRAQFLQDDVYARTSLASYADLLDLTAARAFFSRALTRGTVPLWSPRIERRHTRGFWTGSSLVLHVTDQYANNAVEVDHGRLKASLRPMRRLKRFRSARILAVGPPAPDHLCAAFNELIAAI